MLLFLAIPTKMADHYCYSLDDVNNEVVHQTMSKLKFLTDVNSAKMCNDYQNSTFLLDQLLVMDVADTCHVLQNIENQQETGYMLVNGKSKI